MKRYINIFLLALMTTSFLSLSSCRDKKDSAGEKIEEAADEIENFVQKVSTENPIQ